MRQKKIEQYSNRMGWDFLDRYHSLEVVPDELDFSVSVLVASNDANYNNVGGFEAVIPTS